MTLAHTQWLTMDLMVVQAGTFMHELGHNFGLTHSGTPHDVLEYKPNHLSVMNYLFQTSGLLIQSPYPRFDYARFALPPLDEAALDEGVGLMVPPTLPYTVGTRYNCRGKDMTDTTVEEIDWDCQNGIGKTVTVSIDINENKTGASSPFDILVAESDWEKLVFSGGNLNRQRSLVRSGVILMPVFDPIGGRLYRQPFYVASASVARPGSPTQEERAPEPVPK